MKTTIDIPDPLFRELKKRAAQEGTPVRILVETALRLLLGGGGRAQGRFKLRRATFKGEGLDPEIAEGGWAAIRKRAYEGHGG